MAENPDDQNYDAFEAISGGPNTITGSSNSALAQSSSGNSTLDKMNAASKRRKKRRKKRKAREAAAAAAAAAATGTGSEAENSGATETTENTVVTASDHTGVAELELNEEYAQYVGQEEGRVVDGIEVPDWVDNDYLSSYVSSAKTGNPRKPNNREMTEMVAGVPIEQLYGTMETSEWTKYTRISSDLLYGVVGSNTDTRNWEAIMASDDVVTAAQIATSQMYGGTTVKFMSGGWVLDEFGNTTDQKLDPYLYVVGGNGTVLTSLGTNLDNMAYTLQKFGVKNTAWIDDAVTAMGSYSNKDQYVNTFDQLKQMYNPFADDMDLFDMEGLISGVAPFIDPFKVISGLTGKETTSGTQVVEQTIDANQNAGANLQQANTAVGNTGTTVGIPAVTYNNNNTAVGNTGNTTTTNTADLGSAATTTYPQSNVAGTINTGLQSAGISGLPNQVTTMNDYTGTNTGNLTSQSQSGFGGQKTYKNNLGQQMMVTVDASGNPMTPVPYGYTAAAQGGVMTDGNSSPDVQLARKFLGFTGGDSELTSFLGSNPNAAAKMGQYQKAMAGMAHNRVGSNTGTTGTSLEDFQKMQQNLVASTMNPVQAAQFTAIQPQSADMIASTAGQTTPVANMANSATAGTVTQSGMPQTMSSVDMNAQTAQPDILTELNKFNYTDSELSGGAKPTAAQETSSLIANKISAQATAEGVEAAKGATYKLTNPVQRSIQIDPTTGASEIISGAADAQKAAAFTEAIEKVEATPTKEATIQGQLENLMRGFEGGNVPSWASGAMRMATMEMSARGLGASSMAGQAIVQAAMEAALPIAQADANVMASFEAQNLSNRQQRAMLAAQQRAQFMGMEFDQTFQARVQNAAKLGDIANMNFTADQQIALENSRAVNTVNLANLNNNQAMTMAQAASLSQLDMANLNNRQQAAVQQAQNFLQMDMANLSNTQQTEMFKTQTNVQALLTDQAAENAAEQFNASSENQTNQFFANLSSQVSQYNASQANAMDQFNINTTNAMRQFNAETQNQRDMFNAQNGLVIAQANAQWRQNLATLNTAAQNESFMDYAKTSNALSAKNLDEIWQRERDMMSYAFTSSESAMDRALQIVLGDKKLDAVREQLEAEENAAGTSLMFRFLFGTGAKGLLSGIL